MLNILTFSFSGTKGFEPGIAYQQNQDFLSNFPCFYSPCQSPAICLTRSPEKRSFPFILKNICRPGSSAFLGNFSCYSWSYSVADLAFFNVFPPFYPKPSYFPCFPQRVTGCLTASGHRRECPYPSKRPNIPHPQAGWRP